MHKGCRFKSGAANSFNVSLLLFAVTSSLSDSLLKFNSTTRLMLSGDLVVLLDEAYSVMICPTLFLVCGMSDQPLDLVSTYQTENFES